MLFEGSQLDMMWGIELNKHGGIPLARQIYAALRDRMMAGVLRPGDTLPSTRELSQALSVSRNTACEAYAMLADEGFLETRQGAATRVAAGLALEPTASAHSSKQPIPGNPPVLADFSTGQPDLSQLPVLQFRQMLRDSVESLPRQEWGYSSPAGLPALRQEIAQWLRRGRGVAVEPEEIFITAGATQALHLLACLPALSGGVVAEDPSHLGMVEAWRAMSHRIIPVPADERGLIVDRLEDALTDDVSVIYATPSHQFPLGGVLPAARRAELVRIARRQNLFVVEDDYDSEFRYAGAPIAPLCAMDRERVAYVGTFSKTLFPALRVGYVVLPAALREQWREERRHVDVQSPPFEQAALAELLRSRKFDRHVQRMRKLYGARREALMKAMRVAFGGMCQPLGDGAGLHVAVRFPGIRFNEEFVAKAREAGIRVATVEQYAIEKGRHLDELVLGYGHLEERAIAEGVDLLSSFIASYESKTTG